MYAAPFTYYRAASVAEAIRILEGNPDARLLAGGQSLLPLMKLRLARPAALVDIGRIAALQGVTVSDTRVTIGPLTTHATLASSPEVRRSSPLLAEAASVIGDPAVRNRGTIGGNVVHGDPGSDLPTALTALGASFVITSASGQRTMGAADFFKGFMRTAAGEHEVLTAVQVPGARPGQGTAYVKMFHPASRYALVGAAAVLEARGGRCVAAAVAVGGLVPSPRRAPSVERALVGKPLAAETIADAAPRVANDLGGEVLEDIHASAEYRRAMVGTYLQRALMLAAQRAGAL